MTTYFHYVPQKPDKVGTKQDWIEETIRNRLKGKQLAY